MSEPRTIPDLLNRSLERFGERIALQRISKTGVEPYSYTRLGTEVARLRQALTAAGYRKGDRIALLGKNCPEWAVIYLAVTAAGMIVVPLDSLLKINELKHILADAGCHALFVAEKLASDIPDERENLPDLQRIIVFDGTPEDGSLESLDAFLQVADKPEVERTGAEPPGGDDPAVIIYTSGTTGKSKGVVLTHGNIASNVLASLDRFEVFPEDKLLSVLPLHHTFEATTGFLLPLVQGCTVSYARSLKSKELIEDIRRTGATIMIGVPLLFEKMLNGIYDAVKKKPLAVRAYFGAGRTITNAGRTRGLRLALGRAVFRGLRKKAGIGTLRLFVCGGAPMAPYIQTGFEELGIVLVQGYGATEASPVISANPLDKAKPETVGPPLKEVQVRIDMPNEEGIGEILVKGPNVMKGYYRNPEASAEVLTDGWYHTGDCGMLDADGYLVITGRKKNMIVTGAGKNVYPEEIEIELDRSPLIAECLVTGSLDLATRRESIHAIIVPDYGNLDRYAAEKKLKLDEDGVRDIILREVRERCAVLADYKRVRDIEIRDEEFVKTSTRKIKRYLYQQKSIGVG